MKNLVMTCFALTLITTANAIDFGKTMIVGDSNVAGAGGTAPNSFRYPLHQKLLLAGHTKDFVGKAQWGTFPDGSPDNQHSGFGGWGLYSTLTGLHPTNGSNLGQGKHSDWLSAYSPDTEIVLSAINDWFRWGNSYLTDPNAPSEANTFFRSHFEQLLSESFTQNSAMKVILVGYHRTEYTDGTNESRNALIEDVNSLLATIESEQRGLGRDVTYVDLYSLTQASGHTFDGVHLNAAGADLVADAVLNGMTEAVPEPASMAILAAGFAIMAKRRIK